MLVPSFLSLFRRSAIYIPLLLSLLCDQRHNRSSHKYTTRVPLHIINNPYRDDTKRNLTHSPPADRRRASIISDDAEGAEVQNTHKRWHRSDSRRSTRSHLQVQSPCALHTPFLLRRKTFSCSPRSLVSNTYRTVKNMFVASSQRYHRNHCRPTWASSSLAVARHH